MHDDGASEVPPLPPCRLYLPGHRVHPMQALKASNDGASVRVGTLRAADGVRVVVSVGDEVLRFRNHDTTRLSLIAGRAGGRVEWRDANRCCGSATPDAFVFSMAPAAADWRGCAVQTSVADWLSPLTKPARSTRPL